MAAEAGTRVAVIGAGPAGIVAGRELLAQGFGDFSIFEKASAVGGTWHQHSYPGLACDVKAAAYTFEQEPNPDWTHTFVEREEIEAYLQRCATKFGLDPHLIINAMGNQHTPLYPDLVGMDGFGGDSWHSTEWNHDVQLAGKRVALVGSAAAAVQIVPEVAKEAGHLYVLQRTPNWILPRGRKPYSSLSRALRRFQPLGRLHRALHRQVMYLSSGAFQLGHKTQARVEAMGRKHIEEAVADPILREVVTPQSRFGCKRPLMSDWFYPALQRENVTLIPSAAKSVHERGITTVEGQDLAVDVIIYCTGYKVMDFDRIEVIGRDGRSLGKCMAEAPEAFKGFAVRGFPNYFFALGPNSLVTSASYFEGAEVNLACVIRILEEKAAAGARAIEVKEDALRGYNEWIVAERERYSWGVDSCNSYYRAAGGHTPFLFPGDFATYKRQRSEAGLHDFDVV
jgi:cation diffusion facilitator CzcD-associated flavoprotein CzcO